MLAPAVPSWPNFADGCHFHVRVLPAHGSHVHFTTIMPGPLTECASPRRMFIVRHSDGQLQVRRAHWACASATVRSGRSRMDLKAWRSSVVEPLRSADVLGVARLIRGVEGGDQAPGTDVLLRFAALMALLLRQHDRVADDDDDVRSRSLLDAAMAVADEHSCWECSLHWSELGELGVGPYRARDVHCCVRLTIDKLALGAVLIGGLAAEGVAVETRRMAASVAKLHGQSHLGLCAPYVSVVNTIRAAMGPLAAWLRAGQ